MIEVGQLERHVGASVARAIEDELDWEHLPFTHASTFSAVKFIGADRAGWEAHVVLTDGSAMRMRVTIDADRMGYVNATFDADGTENGRTVCRIAATGADACHMALRFFVPERVGLDRAAAGAFYTAIWNRLIDEDEPKMIYRAAALRAGAAPHRERRSVILADGSTHAVPLVCPHQGLPLNCEPNADGILQCPWHGYRFDVRTGVCISGRIKGWKMTASR